LSEIEGVRYQPVADEFEKYLIESTRRQPPASGIPGFIDEQQFANQLGLSRATVRRWRRQGYGPAWIKIGRRDYTRETAAEEFAAAQLAKAEAAAKPRGRGRPRSR
jgi:hypothetical protein